MLWGKRRITLSTENLAGPSSQDNGDLNPFDLSGLRLTQDFIATAGVKKLVATIPVRRPDRQSFIRVHPEHRIETNVIEVKEDNETYLVERNLWPALSVELTPKLIVAAINRQDVAFLWPIRLPGPDGRLDPWNTSALTAAERAMREWVRVTANRSLGAYDIFTADATLPDPVWPDISFEDLLKIAFRDRFIRDLDHPVIRKLQGKL